MSEGAIDWWAGRTWYEVHGDASAEQALVVLHGGPGSTHFYLQGLARLAGPSRQVVLYDQLGCGHSEPRPGFSDWSVGLFIEELEGLRERLGLEEMCLLGHSWGVSLAVEYALLYPGRVAKMVCSSPLFDSKLWCDEARRLQDELPNGLGKVLQKHEREGTTDSSEYQEAHAHFFVRHECSITPDPPEYLEAYRYFGQEVFNAMWGPSNSLATGVLKDWSCLSRLSELRCPVLITSGQYDSATPRQVAAGAEKIRDMRWQIFPGGTHSLDLEFPERYQSAVDLFLAE